MTLLGSYSHTESRPNYGRLYGRSTAVWGDPPRDGVVEGTDTVKKNPKTGDLQFVRKSPDAPAVRRELLGEYGTDAYGDQKLVATGDRASVIACLFAPNYGGHDAGLLQVSCLCMYLLNDQGDTIDTLVADRRGGSE